MIISSIHLSLQESHFLLQLFDHAVPLLDHHARVLELKTRRSTVKHSVNPAQRRTRTQCVCFSEPPTCAPHLFNHVPDFPLLAFQHVVQMVDLFPENSHLPLQLLGPKNTRRELEPAARDLISCWLIRNHSCRWCVCVGWPLLPFLAFLSQLAQFAQFVLAAAYGLSQGGALLLHPCQQPLELLYALVFLLAVLFCDPHLLPLDEETLFQPAAFSLEERGRSLLLEFTEMQCGLFGMIHNGRRNKLWICVCLPAASLCLLGVSSLLPVAVHTSAYWPPSAWHSQLLHLLPGWQRTQCGCQIGDVMCPDTNQVENSFKSQLLSCVQAKLNTYVFFVFSSRKLKRILR